MFTSRLNRLLLNRDVTGGVRGEAAKVTFGKGVIRRKVLSKARSNQRSGSLLLSQGQNEGHHFKLGNPPPGQSRRDYYNYENAI